MVKVGVVGFGYAAQTFHLPLLLSHARIVVKAVVTSKPDVLQHHYPDIAGFSSIQAMLAACELDLVVITAPNALHFELASICLQAQVNVVLEKPAVTSEDEFDRLVKLANASGCFVSVFHNRRWDGDFLTVKRLIDEKALGELRLFESHFDRFRPLVRQRWREQAGAGSGIWFDLGSHLLDQALVLFGLPDAVTGRCLKTRDGAEADDYFHVQLHYAQLDVILQASCLCAAPNARFMLQGSDGTYVKTGLDPQEEQLKNGLSPRDVCFGQYNDDRGILYGESSSTPVAQDAGCYWQYYDQLAAAILDQAPVPVPLQEIGRVMGLLLLAQQSSLEGKTHHCSLLSGELAGC